MKGYNKQHIGRSPYTGPVSSSVVSKWSYTTGWIVSSSPAIGTDGTVYIASRDAKLYALNGTNGALKWSYECAGGFESSPAIGTDGTVYIGNDDAKLYAFNGATGAVLWSTPTAGWVRSSPAIGTDGTVYVGSNDDKLYAFNGATGAVLWSTSTGGNVESSPAIGTDGTVYVGSLDRKLYAFNGATGAVLWSYTTGDTVTISSPAVGADGKVYFGSWDYKVYALNGATGAVVWSYTTGDIVYSSPAIGADGTVYVGSYDRKVYALNGATGAVVWNYTTNDGVISSPAIGADGTVYIGSWDTKLYALNGATGALKWSYTTNGVISSSPAIGADGCVYIGSDDRKVHAIMDSSSTPAPTPASTPAPTPASTPAPTPASTPAPANCSIGAGYYNPPSYDGSLSSVSNTDGLTFTVSFPNAAMDVISRFDGASADCNMTYEYYDRPQPTWQEIWSPCDASVTVSSGPLATGILSKCGFTTVNNVDGSFGSKGRFKLTLVERASILRGITVNKTSEYAILVQVNFAAFVTANASSVRVYGAASVQAVVTNVLFDTTNYGSTMTLTTSVQSPYIFTSISYNGQNPRGGYTLTPVGLANGNCSNSVSTSCVQSWTIQFNTTTACDNNGGPSNMNVNDWVVTLTVACDTTKINCTGVPSPLNVNATFSTSSSNFCATIIGTITPTLTLAAYSGDNLIPQSSFVFGAKTYFRAVMDSPVSINMFKITEIRIASGAASYVTGPLYTNTYDSSSTSTVAAFWAGTNTGGISNSFPGKLAIDFESSANTTSPYNYFWITFDSSLSSASGDNPTDTTVFINTRIKYTGSTGSAERDVHVMKIKNKNGGEIQELADIDATPGSMSASTSFAVVQGTSSTPPNTASSASTSSNLAVIAVASVGGAIAILSVAAIVAVRKRRNNIAKEQGDYSINLTSLETPVATA